MLLSLAPAAIRTFYVWFRCRTALVDPNSLIEYRALWKVLKWVLVYILFWQAAIFFALVFYVSFDTYSRNLIISRDVNGPFWAIFHTISGFNNAGFSIFTDNLIAWNTTPYVIIWLSIGMLMGNLAFPISLRITFYVLRYISCTSNVYFFLLFPLFLQ